MTKLQNYIPAKAAFEKKLAAAKLNNTAPRRIVFAILAASELPLTISEIIPRTHQKAHFVSIYRSVDSLLKAGIIMQIPIGFKNKFELSDEFKPHHHHVTCEQCGKSIAIKSIKIERLMQQMTQDVGMEPRRHHFEAYGICNVCQTKPVVFAV